MKLPPSTPMPWSRNTAPVRQVSTPTIEKAMRRPGVTGSPRHRSSHPASRPERAATSPAAIDSAISAGGPPPRARPPPRGDRRGAPGGPPPAEIEPHRRADARDLVVGEPHVPEALDVG